MNLLEQFSNWFVALPALVSLPSLGLLLLGGSVLTLRQVKRARQLRTSRKQFLADLRRQLP
jgi:hypothetical protein